MENDVHLLKTNDVLHISITIEEGSIEDDAFKILHVIRPNWSKDNIKIKLLTDGITNKLVGCSNAEDCDGTDVVLVRVYGHKTDMIIDRKAETRNIILLHSVGLAPRLYATFNNGLAYEYVQGCTLSPETIVKPCIYKLIARQMAQLHRVTANDDATRTPMLWTKLQQFFDLVPDTFTDEKTEKKYRETIMPKSQILEEILSLKVRLTELSSPVVFAHNDLLLGNVIYNEDTPSVTFIDYEYAAYNYQAYDIGNHFAEFVGLDEINYSQYPDKSLQYAWLRTYLEAYQSPNPVDKSDVERLYVQVNQFALVAHIFWGIWSLIQAEHSTIDFDYLGYAAVRFEEFFKRKETFLSLKLP